jgi:hypothetical protein
MIISRRMDMVTKDDALEFLMELGDIAEGLGNEKVRLAILERVRETMRYVKNSDYKICPAIKD